MATLCLHLLEFRHGPAVAEPTSVHDTFFSIYLSSPTSKVSALQIVEVNPTTVLPVENGDTEFYLNFTVWIL